MSKINYSSTLVSGAASAGFGSVAGFVAAASPSLAAFAVALPVNLFLIGITIFLSNHSPGFARIFLTLSVFVVALSLIHFSPLPL